MLGHAGETVEARTRRRTGRKYGGSSVYGCMRAKFRPAVAVLAAVAATALAALLLPNNPVVPDRTDPEVRALASLFNSKDARTDVRRYSRATGQSRAEVVRQLAELVRLSNEAELGAIRVEGVFPRDDTVPIDRTASPDDMAEQLRDALELND